jgi:hypothetical protein
VFASIGFVSARNSSAEGHHERTNLSDRQRRYSGSADAAAQPRSLHSARNRAVIGPKKSRTQCGGLREQFLKDFDPTYVENVIVPPLPGKHLYERPTLPTIGLNLTKESGLLVEIWGIDQGKLEPNTRRRSHGFSPGTGEAEAGKSPREKLHIGSDPRPVSTDV